MNTKPLLLLLCTGFVAYSPSLLADCPNKSANSTIAHATQVLIPSQPIEKLRLIGVIQLNRQKWAVIEAPDGKAYQVSLGHYVSCNKAKLVNVSQTSAEFSYQADGVQKTISLSVESS